MTRKPRCSTIYDREWFDKEGITALEIAEQYIDWGWNPTPGRYQSRTASLKGWQDLVIDRSNVSRYFNGAAQNIDVVLALSNGLTDVDLDCREAIALAPYFLEPTKAVFGRASKRRAHWLYITTLAETATKAAITFPDPLAKEREKGDKAMLVELRTGPGAQTVFPGSVHDSGERIEWDSLGDPKPWDGADLQRRVAWLAAAAAIVRVWPGEGLRHNAALVLGGLLARLKWPEKDAEQFARAIFEVARDTDEIDDRIQAIVDSRKAYQEDRKTYGFPKFKEQFGEPTAKAVMEWLGYRPAEERKAAKEDEGPHVTEDSAALAFVGLYKGKLHYCHDTGAWFQFNGSTWRQNRTDLAFHYARELARTLGEGQKVTSKTSFAGGVERFSRADPALAVTAEHWDQDPWLLGTPGGVVDLRMGELRAGRPEDSITKQTAVVPSDSSDCPLWIQFLEEATDGDRELIRFIQQWAGYSLTGSTREQALAFIHGDGGTGKSVFLKTLSGILSEYACTSAVTVFLASAHDQHTTSIAMMRGARLVTASETQQGRAWNEALIKSLTGGDPITARFMRQDDFTYTPQFKLCVIGNHAPVVSTVDEAMRRRFNIVPFVHKPVVPDLELENRLKAEWAEILRWAIEGGLDWQRHGLVRPNAVKECTQEYFSNQDVLGQWLDDECDVELGNEYINDKAGSLFGAWTAYAKRAGVDPKSQTSFASDMKRRGFVNYNLRSKGGRGWYYVCLKPQASRFND